MNDREPAVPDGDDPGHPGRWRIFAPRLWRRGDADDHYAATTMELVLRGLLAYVVLGFVYTAFHIELFDQLRDQLSAQFTVFADYATLAVMVAAWPLLFATALVCGVAGCGVF